MKKKLLSIFTMLDQDEVFTNKIKMKQSLFSRIFLSFSIFIILFLNTILYFSYYFTEKTYISNIKSSIYSQLTTIKTFININNSNAFSLPLGQVRQLNNMWLFFNIQLSKRVIKTQFIIQNNKLFLETHYHNYNIIIWKDLKDLSTMKHTFINVAIYLNIFLIIFIFFFTYFITKFTLKPLYRLVEFLENYKLWKNTQILENNYWNKDIWKLINTVNKFIKSINQIYNKQKEFIQDTSHELKTPLMQINTNLDLIENKIKDEKIISKLDSIRQSTEYLNNLVSNLNFILQNQNQSFTKENINIKNYLQDLIEKFNNLAKEKNISIRINKFNDLLLDTNKYYLDRLFENLITNAIVYNKKNWEVNINIYKNKVEIIDTWIWISQEEQNKIFNRFYRNSDSWKYYQNGSWLGLAIVKKICSMFGWKITVDSVLWEWTKFTIKFK